MYTKQILPDFGRAAAPAIAAKTGNPLAMMMAMNPNGGMNPLAMMAMMGANPKVSGAFQDQYGPAENPSMGPGGYSFAPPSDYNPDASISSIVDGIINNESGGNPNARNPYGSAGGLGQFIDSTWLGMIDKYRPDLAGTDRSTLLNMKYDPALNKEMTARYVTENRNALQSAGLPAGPGEVYLAHFLGAGGAINLLKNPPNTPLTSVLSDEIFRANPMTWRGKGLREMTVGELQQMFREKMGA